MNNYKDNKPEPEIIGDYIHYRIRDPKLFIQNSFRTIDISTQEGIKAVVGKLINPPEGQEGSMVVQKYLFDKDKWTIEKAREWVLKNSKLFNGANMKDGIKILGTKENPFVKTFDISDLKIAEENGLVVIRGYANTKNKADRYGDIPTVFPSLRNYVYELSEFKKNPVMLLDHRNEVSHIAGSFKEIEEDEIGLRVKAVFSNSELPEIKHARTVYLEGHAKAFSIAGQWFYEDKDNPTHLTYAKIYHISPVGVGADPDALGFADIENIKNINDNNNDKDENDLESVKSILNDISETIQIDKFKENVKSLKELIEKI